MCAARLLVGVAHPSKISVDFYEAVVPVRQLTISNDDQSGSSTSCFRRRHTFVMAAQWSVRNCWAYTGRMSRW